MEQFIQSPPSSETSELFCRSGRLLILGAEHHMQPARIKLHAKEHTNNPVQRPNFRGQGTKRGTMARNSSPQTPAVIFNLRSKFVINPDPTPVVKLKIPKKPGPQKSLQEVAAARATENLRRDKKGKVREQVDLFVVAQKAQVVLCYHKKGRQKENL